MGTVFNVILLIIIGLYPLSLIPVFLKKRFNQRVKIILQITNVSSLALTVLLLILWAFSWHVINLSIELFPFWIFMITSTILYGFTKTEQGERIVHGFIYFGNLFLIVLSFIPFLGLGIVALIYSPFLPDHVDYQNKQLVLTEESRALMSPKGSPVAYLRCGLLLYKQKTHVGPIWEIDSVRITKGSDKGMELNIYTKNRDPNDKSPKTERLDCACAVEESGKNGSSFPWILKQLGNVESSLP